MARQLICEVMVLMETMQKWDLGFVVALDSRQLKLVSSSSSSSQSVGELCVSWLVVLLVVAGDCEKTELLV